MQGDVTSHLLDWLDFLKWKITSVGRDMEKLKSFYVSAAAAKSLQSCPTLRPHKRQPTRLPHPWDSLRFWWGCKMVQQQSSESET